MYYHVETSVEDLQDTVDSDNFDVLALRARPPVPDNPEKVRFSVSHMSPNEDIPTRYLRRSLMFYNTDVDRVLRAFGSKHHFFGHTHEWADAIVDGVRYTNRPLGYSSSPPPEDCVVEL